MEKLTIDQFTVWCENREEALTIKQEIFTHHTYFFETDSPTPIIIDAGAHIGLATLYFKKLYPTARIWAIEPHPVSFALLQRNIQENYLEEVTCLHGALVAGAADKGTTHRLYADTEFNWFSTAASTPGAWNKAQQTAPLEVPALSLTKVIENIGESIDLLKLDIEGSEQQIVQSTGHNLAKVAHIICEYHMTEAQNRDRFLELLEAQGYQVTHEDKKEKFHGKRELELIEAIR